MTYPALSAIEVQFRSLPESGSVNVNHGAHKYIRLFMFERGSEAIGAGITVQAERQKLFDRTSQSGKTKNRWGCEFREESANDFFDCGG